MKNPSTTGHAEARYAFAELTSESIAVYENGKILACNHNFPLAFGYEPSEVTGMSLLHFFPKIYREIVNADTTAQDKHISTLCVRKDSSTFPATVIVKNASRDNKNIRAVVIRDETDRENLANQLVKSNIFQSAILKSANFAIITTDFSGIIKTFNKGAEKIFGLQASEVIGTRRLPELYPQEHIDKKRQEIQAELNKTLATDFEVFVARLQNQASDEQEWTNETPGGPPVICSVTITTLKDNLNEINGYLFTCIDITDRKKAEMELRDSAQNLEKINKELDQFAYIVSHDLKAPLRAISNLSLWIEEDIGDQLDEDSKANLDLMRDRVQRMQKLIEGILEYSRVGRIKAENEEVDVGEVLREVKEAIAIPEAFRLEIPEKTPTVRFNKTWLEQVFSNLLSNAIKYHHKKEGTIKVSHTENAMCHRFCVSDDGPGIKPEYHEKIFQIFQTLESKDKTDSTGIGLTIVKKIIEEHGGEIQVESDGESGTTFTFTIPK